MAKEFCEVAHLQGFRKNNITITNKWFGYNSGQKIDRTGYLLGLEVVWHIAKKTDIHQMVTWDLKTMHTNVIKALKEIADNWIPKYQSSLF